MEDQNVNSSNGFCIPDDEVQRIIDILSKEDSYNTVDRIKAAIQACCEDQSLPINNNSFIECVRRNLRTKQLMGI